MPKYLSYAKVYPTIYLSKIATIWIYFSSFYVKYSDRANEVNVTDAWIILIELRKLHAKSQRDMIWYFDVYENAYFAFSYVDTMAENRIPNNFQWNCAVFAVCCRGKKGRKNLLDRFLATSVRNIFEQLILVNHR